MNQQEWLADIGAAADDLGYGIRALEPGSVTLEPMRGGGPRDSITVESFILSGAYLRRVLAPIPNVPADLPEGHPAATRGTSFETLR